ncbi:MAG TPA: hypothetical protein VM031_04430 [Phycisphaerae bacterium]|nr:hypothetical protein [Phycisphaerae bacterium]
MKFLFDHNISVRLARMIDAYDSPNEVRHLSQDERFARGVPDAVLLETIRHDTPRPVLVTRDVAMRTTPDERKALASSGLTVVFLRFRNLDFHTQAVRLLKLWPEIVREAEGAKEPTAFEVTAGARKVQRLRPTAEL